MKWPFALLCVMALARPAVADPVDGKPMSGLGPSFRRFSQAQYGKWLPVGWEKREQTRIGYRVWMDLPSGRDEEARALLRFIVGLVVRTNQVATTAGWTWPPIKEPIHGIEDAIAYRRDRCFACCEKVNAPTGGMLRGTVDFADDQYVGYTVTENCWYMGNNNGEFSSAHGVYDRKKRRASTLADFFPPSALAAVTAALRDDYASAVSRDRYETWAEFRKRYPKGSDPIDGAPFCDPEPNDSFTLDDSGITWSFEDASVVGYESRRWEPMLGVCVSWRTLRKHLRDRRLMPVVNSIWYRNSSPEE